MAKAKKIGMVSLGCPKATVDSELILTRLRAEGYVISPDYEGADLVLVNTCGFIDAAVEESLDAIGEALAANGKVIETQAPPVSRLRASMLPPSLRTTLTVKNKPRPLPGRPLVDW